MKNGSYVRLDAYADNLKRLVDGNTKEVTYFSDDLDISRRKKIQGGEPILVHDRGTDLLCSLAYVHSVKNIGVKVLKKLDASK